MRLLSLLTFVFVLGLFSCTNNSDEPKPKEQMEDTTATVDENRPMTEEEIRLQEEQIQRQNLIEDAKTNKRSKLDFLNMKMDKLMNKYHTPEYEPKRAQIEEYIQSLHMKANEIRTILENTQAETLEEFNEKTLDFDKRLEKFEAELDNPKEF